MRCVSLATEAQALSLTALRVDVMEKQEIICMFLFGVYGRALEAQGASESQFDLQIQLHISSLVVVEPYSEHQDRSCHLPRLLLLARGFPNSLQSFDSLGRMRRQLAERDGMVSHSPDKHIGTDCSR